MESESGLLQVPTYRVAFFPRQTPSRNTVAGDLMHQDNTDSGPTAVQADGWLTHARAHRYEVMEGSVRSSDGSILSFLWWKNEKQDPRLNGK
jgi:hypothetical protein